MSRPRPRRQRPRTEAERQESAEIVLNIKRSRLWRNEFYGCIKFLESLEEATSLHGIDWAQRMKRYYAERAARCLANVPKGCEREANEYRKRLTELVG